MIENVLNPIIQRLIQRIENRANRNNGNTIYTDTQNVHSSSIQQSIRDSINNLMNAFIVDYSLTYLDWSELNQKTKEIITEYLDCIDIHSILNITFKELFIAVVIEMDKLLPDLQVEIQKRMNEEMQDSECKCFTGRISRLVNCLSGYSDKVRIQISENEEINNIISVIMSKREMKTIEILKEEVQEALTERGYNIDKITEWLEYVEI
jgi:membrane carboxypeptidase/penicillin-binding protein